MDGQMALFFLLLAGIFAAVGAGALKKGNALGLLGIAAAVVIVGVLVAGSLFT